MNDKLKIKLKWSKELVKLLLIKYEEHGHLYDVNNPLYLDRTKRLNSLYIIRQELRKLNKDITIEEIKKKIHSLRTQYIKELHDISDSKKNGAAVKDIYVPKLWCFQQLQFLKSYCTTRNYESKLKFSKKKISKIDKQLEKVKNLLAKRLIENNDYEWLGMQVVFIMKSIKSEKIRQDTAWQIQRILRETAIKDKAACNNQEEKHLNNHQNVTRNSFNSSPTISVRKASDLMEKRASQPLTGPAHPVRLISAKSFSSYFPSPDILQQSLDGL